MHVCRRNRVVMLLNQQARAVRCWQESLPGRGRCAAEVCDRGVGRECI